MVAADRLLELELRDIWAQLLETEDIGIDDDFFELGGDSLLATDMLVAVEKLVGKPYPQSGLGTLTIRHMADILTSGPAPQRDLITPVRAGSGTPLFFCHGDYVSRGIYARKLAALIPTDQPIYCCTATPMGCRDRASRRSRTPTWRKSFVRPPTPR
jgi:acyl carrier protein